MKTMQAREAKARFSSLLEAAERGEPTTITKHGKPTAILMPFADATKVYEEPDGFGRHLLAFPGGIDFEADPLILRDVDL